jgi:hypothetical protein
MGSTGSLRKVVDANCEHYNETTGSKTIGKFAWLNDHQILRNTAVWFSLLVYGVSM